MTRRKLSLSHGERKDKQFQLGLVIPSSTMMMMMMMMMICGCDEEEKLPMSFNSSLD